MLLKLLKNKKVIIGFFIIIIILGIFFIGQFRIKKPPIKIGIVGTLTGTSSTTSIDIRDTVIFAVEEINKKGGINGRILELIVKDDKFDPIEALRVDQELIDEGVTVIVGHTFSTPTIKTIPLMNEKNVLMISPTVMSDKLTGIDDNFIRSRTPLDKEAAITARYTFEKLNIKKMAFVYDLINPVLSDPTYNYFKKEMEKLGGEITGAISFHSRKIFSAPEIAGKIVESGAEGVYIIADAIHTALICQHLRNVNSEIRIVVHDWAFGDPVFFKEGGSTVENVISIGNFNINLIDERFLAFKQGFFERYKREMTHMVQGSYEVVQILFYALSKMGDPKKMKDTILKQKEFEGMTGKIVIDKYGDPIRALYIMEIQNGKPELIGTISLEEQLNMSN